MKKLLIFVLFSIATIGLLAGCTSSETPETKEDKKKEENKAIESITLGLVPTSQTFEEAEEQIQPFADELQKETGLNVEVAVEDSFESLASKMKEGKIDLGFMASFAYVQFAEEANIESIVKATRYGSGTYKAQYNVLADSNIESIEDLITKEGLVWAIPDKGSTSGYLFPASQMMDMGVEDVNEEFVVVEAGGHDGAIVSLLNGDADFATTFDDGRSTVKDEFPNVMEDVRVLGYSDEIPNDNISIRKDIDGKLKEQIKQVLLSFNESETVIESLGNVYRWDGIVESKDSDYDVVRSAYEKFPQ